MAMSAPPKTFDFQKTLPHLPVPDLESTCEKFLQWTQVLLDEKEYAATQTIVAEFKRDAGPKLHQKLVAWAGQDGVDNWLESFWDYGYLAYRKPLCINSNVFYLLDEIETIKEFPLEKQIALLIYAILQFKGLIDTQTLPVDMERDQPLCMEQYRKLFTSTRIPQPACDYRKNPFNQQHPAPSDARHIIVFCKNQPYALDVLTSDGQAQAAENIAASIQSIRQQTEKLADDDAVGALSSLERTRCTQARQELLAADPYNAQLLETVENALFVLCLDEHAPQDLTATARTMMHGDGKNRWFDKSFQLIACANGVYGINAEHSGLDGSVIGTMLKFITRSDFAYQWHDERATVCPTHCLGFQLNNAVRTLIKEAQQSFADLTADTQVISFQFQGLGKLGIKDLKISPDAFIQLAMQRAHHRLFGRCLSTYEPVMTRQFLHGRTEGVRTVTKESIAFVETMADPSQNDATRAALLKKAGQEHVARLTQCKNGAGIQRHIFGMINMYRRHKEALGMTEMPQLFTSTAWSRMCHDVFSTSTSDPTGLALAGYGPVVDDGFGIRYVTKNNAIHITMSSRTANQEKLAQLRGYLEEAFYELQRVLQSSAA